MVKDLEKVRDLVKVKVRDLVKDLEKARGLVKDLEM